MHSIHSTNTSCYANPASEATFPDDDTPYPNTPPDTTSQAAAAYTSTVDINGDRYEGYTSSNNALSIQAIDHTDRGVKSAHEVPIALTRQVLRKYDAKNKTSMTFAEQALQQYGSPRILAHGKHMNEYQADDIPAHAKHMNEYQANEYYTQGISLGHTIENTSTFNNPTYPTTLEETYPLSHLHLHLPQTSYPSTSTGSANMHDHAFIRNPRSTPFDYQPSHPYVYPTTLNEVDPYPHSPEPDSDSGVSCYPCITKSALSRSSASTPVSDAVSYQGLPRDYAFAGMGRQFSL